MFTLAETLPNLMTSYGAPLIGAALLLGALGVPVPTTLMLVASGAFIRQGSLSESTLLLALVGAVLGDSLSFALGRLGKTRLESRFGESNAWQRAAGMFQRGGGAAIYFTRWLLTGAAIPVNLAAGSSGYRFERFLLADLAGELTWVVLFSGIGYWFADQWENVGQYLSNASGVALVAAALAAAIYLVARGRMGRRSSQESWMRA